MKKKNFHGNAGSHLLRCGSIYPNKGKIKRHLWYPMACKKNSDGRIGFSVLALVKTRIISLAFIRSFRSLYTSDCIFNFTEGSAEKIVLWLTGHRNMPA